MLPPERNLMLRGIYVRLLIFMLMQKDEDVLPLGKMLMPRETVLLPLVITPMLKGVVLIAMALLMPPQQVGTLLMQRVEEL